MDNLLDLKPIADVANKLIDKISDATSWAITRETPEKIAVKTYIKDIQNSELEPLLKAGIIYSAEKTIKEYVNQNNIVQKAISMLSDKNRADEIENDWVANYMDKARLVSDEEFQLLWAKILAGEAERPGSYSLRTLDNLKNLSKKDAEIFIKAAKLSVHCGDRCIIFDDDEILNKHGMAFSDIITLEESGLMNLQSLTITLTVDNNKRETSLYNQDVVGVIKLLNGIKSTVEIGVRVFSGCGRELMQALDFEEDKTYFIESLEKIKKSHSSDLEEISITAHHIISMDGNGQIQYNKDDLLP